jgi:hypothetical protein
MDDDQYMKEFLRNLALTKNWLRRRYGDRMIEGKDFEDFLQDVALTIWNSRKDPKYMLSKAFFQQKTFYTRKVYREGRMIPISNLERKGGGEDDGVMSKIFVSSPSMEPLPNPTQEDWEELKRKFMLREIDIHMLKMRAGGVPLKEIAAYCGVTVNSIHVRISEIRKKIATERGIRKRRND